ncbi:MAG: hypothetical protein N2746_01080 [Deltaproteobacteria bacterium]|nr:hypothetical protein [Deltaproteobacteria bacterium]
MRISVSKVAFMFLLFLPVWGYSQEIKIISRHSEFSLLEQGKIQKYLHIKSDQDLIISAKGPTYINIKLRAVVGIEKKGSVAFTLTYLRDGAFRSNNEYTLKLEPKKQNRKVDIITEGTYWVSEHKWIQIKVPEGEHIFQISRPVELSEGLIVKVYKSEKEEPALLAKPEESDIPLAPLSLKEKEDKEKVVVAQKVEDRKPEISVDKKETVEAKKEIKEEIKLRYFSVATKLNILVPAGKVDLTYAFSLDLKYISPLLKNRLSFGAEVGYYPLSGNGKNIDPELGVFDYSFSITNIPVFIGVEYLLPLKRLPIGVYTNGGYAMVFSYSTSRLFGGERYTDGIAYGYYIGVGSDIPLGYGFLLTELRFSSAYLKYNYNVKGESGESGNIGGTNFYVGYKLVF